jgi:molybdate transport system substrate-binding protein
MLLRKMALGLFCLVTGLGMARAQTQSVTVFAAASLKTALDDIAAEWRKETGKTVRISYAASGPLAKQIEAGAPTGIFISADVVWIVISARAS